MLDDEENEAHATSRIIEVKTGEIVGLLYVWEDGTKQPFWFDGERLNVAMVDLSKH